MSTDQLLKQRIIDPLEPVWNTAEMRTAIEDLGFEVRKVATPPVITAVLDIDLYSLLLEPEHTIRDRVEVTVENGDWKGSKSFPFWHAQGGKVTVRTMYQPDIDREQNVNVTLDTITLNVNITVPFSSRKDMVRSFTLDMKAFREATESSLSTYGDLMQFITHKLGGFDCRGEGGV